MTVLHTCNGNGTAVGKFRKYGDALSQLSKSEMEVRVLNGLQFIFGEDSVLLRANLSCWHSREELFVCRVSLKPESTLRIALSAN